MAARLRSIVGLAAITLGTLPLAAQRPDAYEVNDTHFHLTNYIQEGTDIHEFLKIMGTRVGLRRLA